MTGTRFSTIPDSRLRGLQRLSSSAGVILLLEALVLGVVLIGSGRQALLPVTVDLAGEANGYAGAGGRVVLAEVDLGVAVVVLCALVGVARLAVVPARIFPRYAMGVVRNHHTARWIEFAFTSSIITFLVAQLNGITDVGALVLVYTVTTGMALFGLIQARSTVVAGHPLLPLCFGAAIGIVPWGIIAFHHVGAGLVGAGPSLAVRVTTVVMLVTAVVAAGTQWHEQRRMASGGDPIGGERAQILLSLASPSLLACMVVFGVLPAG